MYKTKQIIKRKLSSNKAASLAVALILLLVCTVIGAIVLSAANSSAGRVKDTAKNDINYYSIHSAAKLFQDAIDGKEIIVENVPDNASLCSVTCNGVDVDDSFILYNVSKLLEEGLDETQYDTLTLTLTLEGDASEHISTTTSLDVVVDIKLEPDGNMTLSFRNKDNSVFATANMYISAYIQSDPWVWDVIDSSTATPTTISYAGTRTTISWVYNGMS